MELLEEFLNSRLTARFKWGTHDCCLFVADALVHCGYPDYGKGIRGYQTEQGAMLAIRRVASSDGVRGTMQWLAREYGFTPVSPLERPREGDVACLVTPGRPMRYFQDGIGLGIYFGERFWTTGAKGLVAVPLENAIDIWRPACLQQSQS